MTKPYAFTETFNDLDVFQLDRFQTTSGLRLPESYLAFLFATNGGRPRRCWFKVPDWPGKQSCIHLLFGIHSNNSRDIAYGFRELQDRLPEGFVLLVSILAAITSASEQPARMSARSTTGTPRQIGIFPRRADDVSGWRYYSISSGESSGTSFRMNQPLRPQ